MGLFSLEETIKLMIVNAECMRLNGWMENY